MYIWWDSIEFSLKHGLQSVLIASIFALVMAILGWGAGVILSAWMISFVSSQISFILMIPEANPDGE